MAAVKGAEPNSRRAANCHCTRGNRIVSSTELIVSGGSAVPHLADCGLRRYNKATIPPVRESSSCGGYLELLTGLSVDSAMRRTVRYLQLASAHYGGGFTVQALRGTIFVSARGLGQRPGPFEQPRRRAASKIKPIRFRGLE